jgi:hypothetical protein
LAGIGITLPEAPKPGGSYVSVNVRGNIAYVAIQFTIQDGSYQYTPVSWERSYPFRKAMMPLGFVPLMRWHKQIGRF